MAKWLTGCRPHAANFCRAHVSFAWRMRCFGASLGVVIAKRDPNNYPFALCVPTSDSDRLGMAGGLVKGVLRGAVPRGRFHSESWHCDRHCWAKGHFVWVDGNKFSQFDVG